MRIVDLGYAYVLHARGLGREGQLVQCDYDYPATASAFGWDLRRVQRRGSRGFVHLARAGRRAGDCAHSGTDGTVACPDCGASAGDFIGAASEYLARVAQ